MDKQSIIWIRYLGGTTKQRQGLWRQIKPLSWKPERPNQFQAECQEQGIEKTYHLVKIADSSFTPPQSSELLQPEIELVP
jgi:hypothetical protein